MLAKVSIFSPVAVLALGVVACAISCRKTLAQGEARAIADREVATYARRVNLRASDFELREFDDSGNVVDWFYDFRSKTRPTHSVSILINRNGTSEVHTVVDKITDDARRFSGYALLGDEMQAFAVCGSADWWWLKLDAGAARELRKIRDHEGCYEATGVPGCRTWLYLEVDGELSGSGIYGHMGRYGRELHASAVRLASADGPPECPIDGVSRKPHRAEGQRLRQGADAAVVR